MKKKKWIVYLGVTAIGALAILLLFLLPGSKEKDTGDPGTDPGVSTEGKSGENTKDKTEEKTENKTDAKPEGDTGKETEGKTEDLTESTEEKSTSGGNGSETASTEVATEEQMVDGAGRHEGKLGSVYEIPEGFYDISPGKVEEGYFYSYTNPEYEMSLQISEFQLKKRSVGFETEYYVLHNMYQNDAGTQVTYDVLEDNHYVMPDGNMVQISSEYPASPNKAECDSFLEVVQDTFEYHFLPDPDKPTEEEGTTQVTEDPFQQPTTERKIPIIGR